MESHELLSVQGGEPPEVLHYDMVHVMTQEGAEGIKEGRQGSTEGQQVRSIHHEPHV